MCKQRLRRDLHLLGNVIQCRSIIERWYNTTAIKFMNTRGFKENEEKLLEEVTDFFLESLKNAENEREKLYKELTDTD